MTDSLIFRSSFSNKGSHAYVLTVSHVLIYGLFFLRLSSAGPRGIDKPTKQTAGIDDVREDERQSTTCWGCIGILFFFHNSSTPANVLANPPMPHGLGCDRRRMRTIRKSSRAMALVQLWLHSFDSDGRKKQTGEDCLQFVCMDRVTPLEYSIHVQHMRQTKGKSQ